MDAYQPHHDPLHEVATHFRLAALAKREHPGAAIVGAGYSYLRGFKFHAAEHNLRSGRADMAGLGRALLAYPDEIRRVIETGKAAPAKGKVVCTGDSACTTGPRLGFTSGCVYDPAYAEVIRDMNARLAGMGLRRK
jgi:2,4-dienoyl-CoA reductase-like NADH-dependent reductase (Old Yellow Enzyme family)